jgi:hypothetical protein
MRNVKATERLTIEIPGPGEVGRPLIHIEATNVEDQVVIVYSEEIRHLVAASSEAAGMLVEVWGR